MTKGYDVLALYGDGHAWALQHALQEIGTTVEA